MNADEERWFPVGLLGALNILLDYVNVLQREK